LAEARLQAAEKNEWRIVRPVQDSLLMASDDKEVVAAQTGLITVRGGINTLPAMLPYSTLEPFEQGFADTLLARTGMESRMAAQWKANHQKYLRQAEARTRARKAG
jgi:hypothetical protein